MHLKEREKSDYEANYVTAYFIDRFSTFVSVEAMEDQCPKNTISKQVFKVSVVTIPTMNKLIVCSL